MMQFPRAFNRPPYSFDSQPESGATRTGVTAVSSSIVEVVESAEELFTVPDDETYEVVAFSYYGQVAGIGIIYMRPASSPSASSNIISNQAFAAAEEVSDCGVVGHYFGAGETLLFQTSGTGATANVKVSIKRITGFLP